MPEGEVVYWDDTESCGFIETAAADVDVFVRTDGSRVDLSRGARVAFDVTQGRKGPVAESVERLDDGPAGGETNVYGGGATDAGTHDRPGGGTRVYDERGSEPGEDDGPAFCFACGADLGPYPDPAFCPGCGTDLDPD